MTDWNIWVIYTHMFTLFENISQASKIIIWPRLDEFLNKSLRNLALSLRLVVRHFEHWSSLHI